MICRSEIEKIVDWYRTIPKDFRDLETMTAAHRKMACLLFDYAGELGRKYEQAKAAEAALKIAYLKERTRLMTEENMSGVAADVRAKAATANELFGETAADVEYRTAQIQYQAAQDVLRVLGQHIATLKDERRLEGNSSN